MKAYGKQLPGGEAMPLMRGSVGCGADVGKILWVEEAVREFFL